MRIRILIGLHSGRFRPLSGSYISQWQQVLHSIFQATVSVPYRGATFLNIISLTDTAVYSIGFPSPIGELHFSIELLRRLYIFLLGFRPLSGSYISQSRGQVIATPVEVSVPYRGATFLNTIPATPCPVWDE